MASGFASDHGWPHRAVLFAAAVLSALATAATYVLAVGTRVGQTLENEGLAAGSSIGDAHPSALELLDLVGRPGLILTGFAVVALLGFAMPHPVRRPGLHGDVLRTPFPARFARAAACFAVAAGSIAVTEVLKGSLPRPLLDTNGAPTHNSFPSGHTVVAAGLVAALLLALPRWSRTVAAVPGALAVAVVAGATILAGWHRVSDTVGAVLVAATLYFAASLVLSYVGSRAEALRTAGERAAVWGG